MKVDVQLPDILQNTTLEIDIAPNEDVNEKVKLWYLENGDLPQCGNIFADARNYRVDFRYGRVNITFCLHTSPELPPRRLPKLKVRDFIWYKRETNTFYNLKAKVSGQWHTTVAFPQRMIRQYVTLKSDASHMLHRYMGYIRTTEGVYFVTRQSQEENELEYAKIAQTPRIPNGSSCYSIVHTYMERLVEESSVRAKILPHLFRSLVQKKHDYTQYVLADASHHDILLAPMANARCPLGLLVVNRKAKKVLMIRTSHAMREDIFGALVSALPETDLWPKETVSPRLNVYYAFLCMYLKAYFAHEERNE